MHLLTTPSYIYPVSHILVLYRIQPSPSRSQACILLSLSPLILLPSASSSFLLTLYTSLPTSWFPTHCSVCCSLILSAALKLRPRESLSLDSCASLSLSLVARDIYVPSTNYCSSYEPHLCATRGPFLTAPCPWCGSCSPWSTRRTPPAGDSVFPSLLPALLGNRKAGSALAGVVQ